MVFDIHIHYSFEIPLEKMIETFKREFAETGTEHTYVDEKFRGVLLEKNLRDKIYWNNAEKLLGKASVINKKYMLAEVERLMALPEKQSKYADVDLQYILETLK